MSITDQIEPTTRPQLQPPSHKRSRALGIFVVVAIALLVIGVVPRLLTRDRALQAAKGATEAPVVSLVKSRLAEGNAVLELPSTMQPINVASLYARTNGYVQSRLVDIGTKVKAGQLLAVISSPEVDQELAQAQGSLEQARAAKEQAEANLTQSRAQVNQAEANVAQAQANEEIAATTDKRWTRLVTNGVLPKQQGDERRSAFNARHAETLAASAAEATSKASVNSRVADISAARATVSAQLANVRRLKDMQSFERIVAPFDGVVTERRIEKGDLVTAGSGSDKSLFSVAQAKTLRVQVAVPQSFAVDLHPGQTAQLSLTELPGETFHGTVARTAESIATATRTLLTEVQVDNSSGRLLPGMYAEVKFALPRKHAVVLIPGSALIADAQGTRVTVIGRDHHVTFVTVQTGRDLGTEIEVLAGLSGTENLVNNPSDILVQGQQVTVFQPTQGGGS